MLVANPFQNAELLLPSDVHAAVNVLVSQAGAGAEAPFRRQVDLWWAGLTVGVALGERVRLSEDERRSAVKFADGGILGSDPWRINQLELLAIAEGGLESLDDSNAVVRSASEFSVAGMRWLVDRLVGQIRPSIALANALRELHGSDAAGGFEV
jgi:hypothetical protein